MAWSKSRTWFSNRVYELLRPLSGQSSAGLRRFLSGSRGSWRLSLIESWRLGREGDHLADPQRARICRYLEKPKIGLRRDRAAFTDLLHPGRGRTTNQAASYSPVHRRGRQAARSEDCQRVSRLSSCAEIVSGNGSNRVEEPAPLAGRTSRSKRATQ